MSLDVTPLTEFTGAEIRADIESLLVPAAATELRRHLERRGVLVLRGIDASDAQQLALAGALGTLRHERGAADGIFRITIDTANRDSAEYLKGSFLWHMDGTHDEVPLFASLLSARKLSDSGGQTEFANSHAAYDALPEDLKRRIAPLRVVHRVETSMRRAGVTVTDANLRHWRSNPDRVHPLVWTHRSGRKSLVIGCHASHVEGMDPGEGERLLQELLDWTTQPGFVYRHAWSLGDLLIWDNTGVLHRVEPYAADSGRLMHRTTLLGEEPIG